MKDSLWKKIENLAGRVSDILPQGSSERHYHASLAAAFASAGLPFRSQVPIDVALPRGAIVGERVPDFVVGKGSDALVIEIKAKIWFSPDNRAQIKGYLELLGLERGMLLGFSPQQKGQIYTELVTPHSSLQHAAHDNGELAGEKQVGFLQSLWRRRWGNIDGCPTERQLTKAQASRVIDLLQAGTDDDVHECLAAFRESEIPASPTSPLPTSPLPASLPASNPPVSNGAHRPPPHRPIWREQAPDAPPVIEKTAEQSRAEQSPPVAPVAPPPSPGTPVSTALPCPVPSSPSVPPPPLSSRARLDFQVSLTLYHWLLAQQLAGEARSISAMALPRLEALLREGVSLPFPGCDVLMAAPGRGQGKRISVHSTDAAFWGRFDAGMTAAQKQGAMGALIGPPEYMRLLLGILMQRATPAT